MLRFLLLSLALWTLSPGLHADEVAAQPITVKFERLRTGHMAIQAKVNGHGPYRFIFDTGAPVNLVSNKVADEAKIFGKKKPAASLFGSRGQATIRTLEVGAVKAHNLGTMVADHPTVAALARVLGPIEGIIGLTFFGRYRLTIDYQAQELTFVPVNYQPPDVMQKLMNSILKGNTTAPKQVIGPGAVLGFRVTKEARDDSPGVVISEISAGSPAARGGLKAGDRLLVLDERWTDTVLDCYQAAKNLRPDAPIMAVISRDGKEMKVTITPAPGL